MSPWGRWQWARRSRWPCSRGPMRFGFMEGWSPRDARLYRINQAADHLADPDEYRDRLFLRAAVARLARHRLAIAAAHHPRHRPDRFRHGGAQSVVDRKSTRLNSSHANISYAVFCLKKKTKR